jgi:RHH-type proline utilization regulon transcriptional repressor/proline dehydrogenase/delta 1-pyrroline-5-carboxylate dehydrogenase
VVKDALTSAFGSAGQRCSAARVLFVQRDIADKVIGMLAGAMAELTVGDPGLLSTDVGPVIDAEDAKGIARRACRAWRRKRVHRRSKARTQHRARHLLRADAPTN